MTAPAAAAHSHHPSRVSWSPQQQGQEAVWQEEAAAGSGGSATASGIGTCATGQSHGAATRSPPHMQLRAWRHGSCSSSAVGPVGRARSASPLRGSPLSPAKHAAASTSPVQPLTSQQQRLESLRLRSKHTPSSPQRPQEQQGPQQAGLGESDDLPLLASPAPAVLSGLSSISRPAAEQGRVAVSGPDAQLHMSQVAEAPHAAAVSAPASHRLARLLFTSVDNLELQSGVLVCKAAATADQDQDA